MHVALSVALAEAFAVDVALAVAVMLAVAVAVSVASAIPVAVAVAMAAPMLVDMHATPNTVSAPAPTEGGQHFRHRDEAWHSHFACCPA